MATDSLPTSLSHALGSPLLSTRQCAVQLPSNIAVGSVIVGGFTACIMAKYALHHASQHPELQNQVDLRYSEVHFYRPIFASTPITLTLREVHIAKEGSTLRVESHQNGKLTASAHIRITKPSVAVDLAKLETDNDPNWISYHCAFYPQDSEEENARNEAWSDWRVIDDDGSKEFLGKVLNVSLTLSTDIKQKLPPEGVRWLYLRTECKKIMNGQMDMQVLVFNERMYFIAISRQVAVLVPAKSKIQKL
ncbi:PKS-like enzyme [Aspergillus welwitschiae]|uniref:PKS-like enzyme n=1 Tax=Aspergillus welwitschiae TaxID=1341132 RepID=A0A3F3PXL1_9EURO|nr:PKS-like enzyme [Aspergillus welwitschiae]RDH31631.1 PKS-like enzyme [Aspergillus welwitschiae]